MTLSKGKIILIVVVLLAVAGIVTGTVLGIRNAKSDDVPTNSELTDTTTPETPSTPEMPETPVTPEIPVDPGTEEPEPEPPVIKEPEPEISEAEYYEQNIELLKATLKEEYEKDYPGETFTLDETSNVLINEAAGEIYFLATTIGKFGDNRGIRFYKAIFENNILNGTQKNINSILSSDNKEYNINYLNQTRLADNLSESVYNEFAGYLLSKSYDFNGENVSFSKGAEILDISSFNNGDAFGGQYIQFLVIDGDKIYTARLENAMPPTMGNIAIGQIMGYSNNVFKVTEVKDFKEFDYE